MSTTKTQTVPVAKAGKSVAKADKTVAKAGKSPSGKSKRRSDVTKRPALDRFKRVQEYKTKSPGGKPVKFIGKDGKEHSRKRRYRPTTNLKRRHRFYTQNAKGQRGSVIVPARANGFIRRVVEDVKERIGQEGLLWDNSKDKEGRDTTRFTSSQLFKNYMQVRMAGLMQDIYDNAADIARTRKEDTYRSKDPVQLHERHIEQAWRMRLFFSTRGRVKDGDHAWDKVSSTVKDGRTRYLSTNAQTITAKAAANIARASPQVRAMVDNIVRNQIELACEAAMIHANKDGRVELNLDDAKYGIRRVGTFSDYVAAI